MLRVAAIQMTSGPQPEANIAEADRLIAAAAQQGAELVLLPECFAAFGAAELARIAAAEQGGTGPIRRFLADCARRHGVWLIAGSLPLVHQPGGPVYASCLVLDAEGREVACYDKLHLFDVDVADSTGSYRESRDYRHGEHWLCVDTPVGRVGLSICYDLRFPELYQALRADGAELLVVPAAFTAVTGAAHWEVLLRARAIETQCYVLAANQCGSHPNGRQTYGHSCLIDPWGEVTACLPDNPGTLVAEIDPARIQTVRRNMPLAAHRRFAANPDVLPVNEESSQ